ncbi:hypothetical protein ACPEER_10420 [Pasteurella sp. PK-2025]
MRSFFAMFYANNDFIVNATLAGGWVLKSSQTGEKHTALFAERHDFPK